MNIGITCNSKSNFKNLIYCNGITQNVIFLYKLLKHQHNPTLLLFNDETLPDEYDHITFSEATTKKTQIDVILQVGVALNEDEKLKLKIYCGSTIYMVKLGNQMMMDMESMIFDKYGDKLYFTKYGEAIWASPHYMYQASYLSQMYKKNVYESPYIWEPDFVKVQFKSEDFGHKPNIVVMESNIQTTKNCLIPFAIVDKLYNTEPDSFDKFKVCNAVEIASNKCYNNNILPSLLVLASYNKKSVFLGRQTFDEMFQKPDILLSFQNDNELNYLYCEALYANVPLVHNSPALKKENVGFYYDKCDIEQGYIAVQDALKNYNFDDNKRRNMMYLEKLSINNALNIEKYNTLLNMHINKLNYNIYQLIPKNIDLDKLKQYYKSLFDDKYKYSFYFIQSDDIMNEIQTILVENIDNNNYVLILNYDAILEKIPLFGENICYSKNCKNKCINVYGTCDRKLNCFIETIYSRTCLNLTNTTLEILGTEPNNKYDISLSNVNIKRDSDTAIVQIYSKNIESYAKYSILQNSRYAEKHNYSYFCHEEEDDYQYIMGPAFLKPKYISEQLKTHNTVLYIDSDASITNYNIDIKQLNNPNKQLLCCRDYGSWLINSGVLIFNKCENQNILTEWELDCNNAMKTKTNTVYYDQQLLIDVISINIQQVEIKNNETFNCHFNKWNNSLFVLHLMGMSNEFRLKTLQYIYEQNNE